MSGCRIDAFDDPVTTAGQEWRLMSGGGGSTLRSRAAARRVNEQQRAVVIVVAVDRIVGNFFESCGRLGRTLSSTVFERQIWYGTSTHGNLALFPTNHIKSIKKFFPAARNAVIDAPTVLALKHTQQNASCTATIRSSKLGQYRHMRIPAVPGGSTLYSSKTRKTGRCARCRL